MPPDFTGRQVGALRNTVGNGIVVRLMDYRLIHDLRFDELAAAQGVTWNADKPYLVVRYPAAQESVEAGGRIKLGPAGPFKAASLADFGAAQDDYIAECQGQAGKARRRWKAGRPGEAEDE